jgi:hypothetical protein
MEVNMDTAAKIGAATMLMVGLFVASPRLFLIIVLMTAGVAVSTIIEVGKEHFKGSIILHKCCANVHWVFITFYVFAFDKLHPIAKIQPWELAMAAIAISCVLYTFATVNAHQVLANTDPAIFASNNERRSVFFAAWSLGLALVFAWLIR